MYWVCKAEYNFEKTVLRLTYRDVMVLWEVINYQKKEMEKVRNVNSQQFSNVVADEIVHKADTIYDIIFHGLQIVRKKLFHASNNLNN